MTSKTRDTRNRARLLINAYTEALVGIFVLRLHPVQDAVRTHSPEMTVESSYDGEHLNLHARRIVDEIQSHGPEVIVTVEQVTSAFVTAMWDTIISHAHYDLIATKPEIQFLRHLRNACGHDGHWNFDKLKHPAEWRDKKLQLKDAGSPVFNRMLKHGDVMLLFIDIDRKYFEQTTQSKEI